MNQTIHNLLTEQLASWETARNNYAALSGVQVKELNVNGTLYKVQFNPARIVSSGAKVDAKSIKERKCFLCPANLPAVQKGIPFEGHYNILVNPFPIFPRSSRPVPGNRTCRPAHSSPLRGYAGPGTATDRLHHFLQWSQVRRFRSRPRPLPGRQQRLHAY